MAIYSNTFSFWLDRRCADCDVGQHRRGYEIHRLDAPKMRRRAADWLHRFQIFPWALSALLLPALLWPASWWFEIKSINVQNARVGEIIEMTVERSINRSFSGKWSVTLRQWDGAGWVAYCNATGQRNYRQGDRFPVPLTLKWWSNGQCSQLPAGRYTMTTAWVIDTEIFDKSIMGDSNVFEISP